MKKEISDKKRRLLDPIIRNLRAAIKNSALYSCGHPVYDTSIKNLKVSLDRWFNADESLDLGTFQNTLLLDGVSIKGGREEISSEVADYLYARGVAALSFLRGIDIKDLNTFFGFIKNDVGVIRQKGGVGKNIASCTWLKIKEIDYSALLFSAKEKISGFERSIWQTLYDITEESRDGAPPESKVKAMQTFLDDPERSAIVLNKVYKDSLSKDAAEETTLNIREAIARMHRHFKKNSKRGTEKICKSVANLVSKCDPDLVADIFKVAEIDGKSFDFEKEITSHLSDDSVADFITSLMSGEASVDENLLRVFNILVPVKEDSVKMASLVADGLLQKGLLSKGNLSKLQLSVREIFRKHPNNNFMSEMYKVTVESFIAKKAREFAETGRLSPLVKEYLESMRDGLRKEKFSLLLNILWAEDDPRSFDILSSELMALLSKILKAGEYEELREALKVFIERSRLDKRAGNKIAPQAKEALKKIAGSDLMAKAIELIPEIADEEIGNFITMFNVMPDRSIPLLADRFILERDRERRDRFAHIFCRVSSNIWDEIANRVESCSPSALDDIFSSLEKNGSERLHSFKAGLMRSKRIEVRRKALEFFMPVSKEEIEALFGVIKKEKDHAMRRIAVEALLSTRDSATIKRVFLYANTGFFKHRRLNELIELCGQLKIRESLQQLQKILFGWSLINTKSRDMLRVAAIVSLKQIGIPEAIETIKKGQESRRKAVRKMCDIAIKLDQDVETKKSGGRPVAD